LEKFINSSLLSKKQAAKFALKLIDLKKIKVLKDGCSEEVDENIAGLEGYIVATMDAELKKRLRKKGIKILTVRQKKYLMLE
jgi:rRNA-processing protein FCF1